MGKYFKKSMIAGEAGVMEVSQPTSSGVRTRAAKTLALQRLNSCSASASAAAAAASPAGNPDCSAVLGGSLCYLQLRSRRLVKPPLLTEPKKQQRQQQQQQRHQGSDVKGIKDLSSRSRVGGEKSGTSESGSVPASRSCDGDECFGNYGGVSGYEGDSVNNVFPGTERGKEANAEASFGENDMGFETGDRSTRESTPCSIAGELHAIVTPGPSTRQRSTVASIYRNGREDNTQRIGPTTRELEEFFVYAEEQQHRLFMEKYNFDVVNDLPLPGRYEWVQFVP
ncbi:PREDICTED: cyclin-dependent kinase inhibitor 3-like [Tarenaya hassleriana]|uniref:cyclin-dependent kinase inhibitor 3-like n=1 Tax=Tarenaya hassleriana TaxID=28532 RepID=UPI00053C42E9|nr:PREDICTED: cyclin-dependent kinase inhibitor 3-like [Tarenaya hassleriana]